MNVTIVIEDKVVAVNGESLNFDFEIDSNIWAVQWNGTKGHIEYNDANIPNEDISSIAQFQHIVDAHGVEKSRLEAEEAEEAEEARLANDGAVEPSVVE